MEESYFLLPKTVAEEILQKQNQILSMLVKKSTASNIIGNYISEEDAKKLIGRKTTWFWNLRKTGKLSYTKVGSKIYYDRVDILKLLDGNKMEGGNL